MTQPILIDLPEQLRGERVLVRPYRRGDGEALFEAVEESRQHLKPWMPWVDDHGCAADSQAYVRRAAAHWMLREDLPVGLWEVATGKYLGGSGLHRIDWTVPSFEIGYWIRKSEEGKGLMTEAVRLLCDLAFATLDAQRVFIRCDSTNERSAAIPGRLGFHLEGTHRSDARALSGAVRDTLFWALTHEDYLARQTAGSG